MADLPWRLENAHFRSVLTERAEKQRWGFDVCFVSITTAFCGGNNHSLRHENEIAKQKTERVLIEERALTCLLCRRRRRGGWGQGAQTWR